jgi:putative ABC transport system permease protein
MLKIYFLIAIRNLKKHKTSSLINLLGLSIGMAFFIMVYAFVSNELNYDRFHQYGGQIYRVYLKMQLPDQTGNTAITEIPLGPALKNDLPEIEAMVRFNDFKDFDNVVVCNEKSFKEHLIFADSSFFEMFSFPLLYGNPKTALLQKNNVVLSERIAKKYFGENNPLGQRISIKRNFEDTFDEFQVAGVTQNIPANSTIRFDMLLPYDNIKHFFGVNLDEWYPATPNTLYIRLHENSDLKAINKKMSDLVDRLSAGTSHYRGKVSHYLQPLHDIHFSHDLYGPDREKTDRPLYSIILSGLSLLILFIACMNFINFALSRASLRAREVGIRKTFGAHKKQLLIQLLCEFLVFFGCALVLGLLSAYMIQPAIIGFIGYSLPLSILWNPSHLLILFTFIGLVGMLAGLYPALIFARFQPIQVFQNKLKIGGSNWFSRALVVIQFTLSILLMICAFVIMRQIQYMKHKNLGFNADQVLVLSTENLKDDNYRFLNLFRNEFSQRPGIVSVSGIDVPFVGQNLWGGRVKNPMGEKVEFMGYFIDDQFLRTLGIKLTAGRNFSMNFNSDPTSAILINQTLAGKMGWKNPVGQTMPFQSSNAIRNPIDGSFFVINNPTVIGVVKDYHFKSLRESLGPIALFYNPYSVGTQLFMKIRPGNVNETIAFLGKKWKEIAPNMPFECHFLDDDVERQYRHENLLVKVNGLATMVAIFIACLGSLGLIILAVSRRTKEIAIRKILGSSIPSVLYLLVREQMTLSLVANCIAWPIAWYAMNKWLQNFAYCIDMTIWPFLLAALTVMAIALLAVSRQAIRAATANPIDALRYE